MKLCPLCGGRSTGKIAPARYYCWNCLVEYNDNNIIYEIFEDGSLNSFEIPEPYE